MTVSTGYEPLLTPKPVGTDVWVVDGPVIRFYGMPFPTRMVVVRLADGALWLHSPVQMDEGLLAALSALGPVRHLVAPNWIHYAYLPDWTARFPEAQTWVAPGVAERAVSRGVDLRVDHDLTSTPPAEWEGQIDQVIVEGSRVHREAVFFHRASKSLILTDLIENFEADKVPAWFVPLIWLGGIKDPNGKTPIDMRQTFRGGKDTARAAIRQVLDWGPERAIMAHGRWYDQNADAELRRAFRWVLED